MRTVDARVAAVRNRSVRLRRKCGDRLLGAFACLMLLPLIGLAGGLAMRRPPFPIGSDAGLFGASSLLGSSAGGYVLVAVLAAAIAVAVTVLLMMQHGTRNEAEGNGKRPICSDSEERREGVPNEE